MTFKEFKKDHYYTEKITWTHDRVLMRIALCKRSDNTEIDVDEREITFTPPAMTMFMLTRVFANKRNKPPKEGYTLTEEVEADVDFFARTVIAVMAYKQGVKGFDPTNRGKHRKRSVLLR
jgi:hypothetical protein